MPFKSEAQRKYLWANEPEIARDWTDTYGSRIHKLHGGITHADGRRGFPGGSGRAGDTPMGTTSSGALSSGANYGNTGNNNQGGDGQRRSRIQSDRQADFKANPKNYITQDRGGNLPNRTGIVGNTIHNISNFYRDNIYDRRPHDLKARRNFLMKNNLMKLDPVLDQDEYGDPRYSDSDWLTSRAGLEHLQGLGYTGGYGNANDPNNPNYDSSGGGQTPWWLNQPAPVASAPVEEEIVVADSGLGSGHYRVPEQYRAAEG